MNITMQKKTPPTQTQDQQAHGQVHLSSQFEPFSLRWRKPKKSQLWRIIRTIGLLGMVVAIPTGLGMATGVWIDTLWPSNYSWFSVLTPVGFGLGCMSAFFWTFSGQNDLE